MADSTGRTGEPGEPYDVPGQPRDVPPEQRRVDAAPSTPWGDDPPPAPPSATRQDRAAVRGAWSSWSHFRPHYVREGAGVACEIDLKDRIWRGYGEGATDAEAAWDALLDCVASWRRDVPALGCGPGAWLARRGRRRRRTPGRRG